MTGRVLARLSSRVAFSVRLAMTAVTTMATAITMVPTAVTTPAIDPSAIQATPSCSQSTTRRRRGTTQIAQPLTSTKPVARDNMLALAPTREPGGCVDRAPVGLGRFDEFEGVAFATPAVREPGPLVIRCGV